MSDAHMAPTSLDYWSPRRLGLRQGQECDAETPSIDDEKVEIAFEWIMRNHDTSENALLPLCFKSTRATTRRLLSSWKNKGILACASAGNSNAYMPEADLRPRLFDGRLHERLKELIRILQLWRSGRHYFI
jgi:hypothetical protein